MANRSAMGISLETQLLAAGGGVGQPDVVGLGGAWCSLGALGEAVRVGPEAAR